MAEAVAIPARRGDLERRVEELRFLIFGRSLPAVLFALLGWRVLLNLLAQVRALPVHAGIGDVFAGPVTTGVYLLFCVIPVGIYLVRPPRRVHRRERRPPRGRRVPEAGAADPAGLYP